MWSAAPLSNPVARSLSWLARLPFARPANPAIPLAFYVPMGLGFWLWNALRPSLAPYWLVVLPMAGLLAWTLFEYLLHRVAFHRPFASDRLRSIQHDIHLSHHETPGDPELIVSRLVFSAPFAIAFCAAFTVLFGSAQVACLFLVGVIAGYLAYEVIHYEIHHRRRKGPLLRLLARNHLRHHFQDPERCFGVTTPLWDIVFGTRWRGRRPDATAVAEVDGIAPATPPISGKTT